MNIATFVTLFITTLATNPVFASGEHAADQHHEESNHQENEGHQETEISQSIATQAGIKTSTAGPAIIEKLVPVYGTLVTPPQQHAHIRARYSGMVTRVNANIGDRVSKGDVLATVESNDSLRTYRIHAPIDGIIQHRRINAGEVVNEQPLFTLINNNWLWAQLKIFPSQRNHVKAGQKAYLQANNLLLEGQITDLIPAGNNKPYSLANLALDNPENQLFPGEMVEAQIAIERNKVDVAVATPALQKIHGDTVVFIKNNDHYEAHPVTTGKSDGQLTEIISGISPGDTYVSGNSYLIKADILKSGASHSH